MWVAANKNGSLWCFRHHPVRHKIYDKELDHYSKEMTPYGDIDVPIFRNLDTYEERWVDTFTDIEYGVQLNASLFCINIQNLTWDDDPVYIGFNIYSV